MGKRKYNYQVGDTFVERIQNRYTKEVFFTIHHIVQIDTEIKPFVQKPNERHTLLSIHISPGGKFKNYFHKLYRLSLNARMRRSKKFQEFCEEHKLEFLILTGKTIHEIINEALERHKKHQNRYHLNVNPEQINIKEEETENE